MEQRKVINIRSQRDTDLCSPDYQHNELHLLPGLPSDTALAPGEEKHKISVQRFCWKLKMLNLIFCNRKVSKWVKLESLNLRFFSWRCKTNADWVTVLKWRFIERHSEETLINTMKNPIVLMTHLFQNTFIKKLLQLFITIVDAELLEAVVLEIL